MITNKLLANSPWPISQKSGEHHLYVQSTALFFEGNGDFTTTVDGQIARIETVGQVDYNKHDQIFYAAYGNDPNWHINTSLIYSNSGQTITTETDPSFTRADSIISNISGHLVWHLDHQKPHLWAMSSGFEAEHFRQDFYFEDITQYYSHIQSFTDFGVAYAFDPHKEQFLDFFVADAHIQPALSGQSSRAKINAKASFRMTDKISAQVFSYNTIGFDYTDQFVETDARCPSKVPDCKKLIDKGAYTEHKLGAALSYKIPQKKKDKKQKKSRWPQADQSVEAGVQWQQISDHFDLSGHSFYISLAMRY